MEAFLLAQQEQDALDLQDQLQPHTRPEADFGDPDEQAALQLQIMRDNEERQRQEKLKREQAKRQSSPSMAEKFKNFFKF